VTDDRRAVLEGGDGFWTREPGWVLVRSEHGLLPFNRETKMIMLIDDEGENATITALMERDGVPVLDSLPDD
jgi:hypothetical protein